MALTQRYIPHVGVWSPGTSIIDARWPQGVSAYLCEQRISPSCSRTEWTLGREPADEVLHSEGWHQYVLDSEGLHWQRADRKALHWELVCSEGLALGSVSLTSWGSTVNLALKAVCSEAEPAVVRRYTASANVGRQFTLLVQNLLAQVNLYRFFF